MPVLELEQIQGTLLRPRPEDYRGAYLLYRVDDAAAAKRSLCQVLPEITTAAAWQSERRFTLNIAFTYGGLQALGVPAESLASFAPEFVAGMAARHDVLGDVGDHAPETWVAPLGRPEVHIGVLIISQTDTGLEQPLTTADSLDGVTQIYRLDVGMPPTRREHFGFRDGIGGPHILGSGMPPLPGRDELMPGEFVLGYEDERGMLAEGPVPEVLGRNGTYLAFRLLRTDVAAFRRYLRANARSAEEEELLAAKVVGRWRSGAPLALAPERDDPALAADPQRNNDFLYHDADPKGLRVPLGAHIRRANPRDALTDTIVQTNIHRVVRRGAAYGPVLPDGVLEDDGVDRGILFIFMGASLARQFEFVQQVWLNDGDFAGLGTAKDPLVGDNLGQGTHTIPATPIRRRLTGLPTFVQVRGGEYCFLPSLAAIEWITAHPDQTGQASAGPSASEDAR